MPCAPRERAERAEQRVGDGLRGLDVAGDDRGRIVRRQHRAFRDDELDRLQAAGIDRNVVVDHDAEHVEHGGARHRRWRIEVGRLLRRGAGEIDCRRALLLVDIDAHLDDGALVHLVAEFAVVQAVDDAAHAFGGVVLHVMHVGLDDRQREMAHHLAQLLHALLVGGDLRLHVVDVLQRIARRIFRACKKRIQLLSRKRPRSTSRKLSM